MTADTDKNRPAAPSKASTPSQKHRPARPDDKEHEGATEDQVLPTPPPKGSEYNDEPKEG